MKPIAPEVAEAEITAWLDAKKVMEDIRTNNVSFVETLVSAISEGRLIRDSEKNELTYKLSFPIGSGEAISELKFKARINDKMVRPYLKGVKGDDSDGRMNATISALTGQARAIIDEIDSVDKKVVMAIAVFFY